MNGNISNRNATIKISNRKFLFDSCCGSMHNGNTYQNLPRCEIRCELLSLAQSIRKKNRRTENTRRKSCTRNGKTGTLTAIVVFLRMHSTQFSECKRLRSAFPCMQTGPRTRRLACVFCTKCRICDGNSFSFGAYPPREWGIIHGKTLLSRARSIQPLIVYSLRNALSICCCS